MDKNSQNKITINEEGFVQIEDEMLLSQIQGGMAVMDDFGDQFSNGACVNASCS